MASGGKLNSESEYVAELMGMNRDMTEVEKK